MEIRHKELKGIDLDYLTLQIKENGNRRTVHGYFYNGRRSSFTQPKGYNIYDLRETDDGECDIASIKDFVLVNHYGTFITNETIACANNELEVISWDFDPWEDRKYWDRKK